MRPDFPFSAVVGQEELKLALLLTAVDPSIGGVLIAGERGTAKSTAARGLAALLPKSPEGKPAPFVELPLGATEDRVVGSLDLSQALKEGRTVLRSGLLARAHGGVLYVDEVNLLPDHIVDLLLDAAASGWISIERDGVSAREPAEFIVVGTMNPEEGDLRPQFLDRFGLCVPVRGLEIQETRIEAVRQRLHFDDRPTVMVEAAEPAEDELRRRIASARQRLSTLSIADGHLASITTLAAARQVDGIRGDLALIKAARALAAWEEASAIAEDHIRRVADLALTHRSRPRKPPKPPRSPGASSPPDSKPAPPSINGLSADEEPPPRESPALKPAPPASDGGVRFATDVIDRTRAGRRGTDSLLSQRAVHTLPRGDSGTLAVTETLTAAAQRGARVGTEGVVLTAPDLRQHERRGPGRSEVLFLVDASGSMGTQRRLEAAKGAALGLLTSSYQRRDEVALMVFRGQGSDLVLPFTRQVAKIEEALREVPLGGRTPLARALLDAAQMLRARESSLLVLFTDGRANVAVDGQDPWREALDACSTVRAACSASLVVDCEAGPILLGRPRVLAEALGGECVGLDTLDGPGLTLRIHRRLEGL